MGRVANHRLWFVICTTLKLFEIADFQEEVFSMDLETVFLDLVLEGTHGCKEVNHLTRK